MPPRTPKDAAFYEIEALAKGLKVLMALEDGRPVTMLRLHERTQLNANYCFRALKTLEIAGLARETQHGWQLTGKGTRLIGNAL